MMLLKTRRRRAAAYYGVIALYVVACWVNDVAGIAILAGGCTALVYYCLGLVDGEVGISGVMEE